MTDPTGETISGGHAGNWAPIGRWSDLHGRRRLLLAGASLYGVVVLGHLALTGVGGLSGVGALVALVVLAAGLAALGALRSPAGVLAGAALIGLGTAFLTPAIFAAVFSSVPPAERGAAAQRDRAPSRSVEPMPGRSAVQRDTAVTSAGIDVSGSRSANPWQTVSLLVRGLDAESGQDLAT